MTEGNLDSKINQNSVGQIGILGIFLEFSHQNFLQGSRREIGSII